MTIIWVCTFSSFTHYVHLISILFSYSFHICCHMSFIFFCIFPWWSSSYPVYELPITIYVHGARCHSLWSSTTSSCQAWLNGWSHRQFHGAIDMLLALWTCPRIYSPINGFIIMYQWKCEKHMKQMWKSSDFALSHHFHIMFTWFSYYFDISFISFVTCVSYLFAFCLDGLAPTLRMNCLLQYMCMGPGATLCGAQPLPAVKPGWMGGATGNSTELLACY